VAGQVLNGIAYGSLLFVLATGFTIALGLMRVVNIAHGAFYMLGVYIGLTIMERTGNFILAAAGAAVVVMLIAAVLNEAFLKRLSNQPLRQVLFTFGVTLVIAESIRHIWGGYPKLMATPDFLRGTLGSGTFTIPVYRAFVIGVALALGLGLWIMMTRTRVGAIVRACIDDQEIAGAIGIDVQRVFTLMFGFAGLLAGFGGAIGAPFIGAYQGVQFDILTLTLVVVVIGGLGSIPGALLGSILIGVINSVGIAVIPQLAYFLLFGPMIVVLTFRPMGLLGRRE
jgi:branched-chain amino acid transport system permease protein